VRLLMLSSNNILNRRMSSGRRADPDIVPAATGDQGAGQIQLVDVSRQAYTSCSKSRWSSPQPHLGQAAIYST